MSYQPKVALVHDDFSQQGGAESLFATIAALYPKAPIYTSLVNWQKLPSSIEKSRIRTSFMQKIPFATRFYKLLLPLYPLAFESFNFDKFDVVISSTTRFAKSIITRPNTIHIAYLNSAPRFLWNRDLQNEYLSPIARFLLTPLFAWLRRWDKASSARVDFYIANSQNVKNKIKEIYGRESEIVYPYANTDFFKIPKIHNWGLKSRNYFLIVSRLVKWKKIDLAIEAVRELGANLIIVGDGPDKKRLENLAVSRQPSSVNQITFAGKVTIEELRSYYQNCVGLIVTQEEDFGIAQVEAQACGKAVIAYQKGGSAETVIDGKTGILFKTQNKESLKDAIVRFSKVKWGSAAARNNSLRFSKAAFTKGLKGCVTKHGRSKR